MRATEYEFVETDGAALQARLIRRYEELTERTLHPADPERLFLAWMADALIAEKIDQNYMANQNLPSRAEGENLDALGRWLYGAERLQATNARCTVRFTISEAQSEDVQIPMGTRVTDVSQSLVWETESDAVVVAGSLTADVPVVCQTEGAVGNGYTAGQICRLIDVDDVLYYQSCANIDTTAEGADTESDDAYYERLKLALGTFSTAGSAAAYQHFARSASADIIDVKVVRPRGQTHWTGTPYYDGDGHVHYFFGGDRIREETLEVVDGVRGTDYTALYESGLLDIEIKPGSPLEQESSIEYSFYQDYAGRIYIYALMSGGVKATTAVKDAILAACSADTVRPLTDKVEVKDASYSNYNINLTYYSKPGQNAATVSNAVYAAIEDYVEWQHSALGRNINPQKLWYMLMDTGYLSRVDITSPNYTELKDGSDGSVPQVAHHGTTTVVDGGESDE